MTGGDTEGNFVLSPSGALQLRKDLDREYIPVYSIIIKASSNRNWTPPRSQRASRLLSLDPGRDPTLQEVRVHLEDINDQSPHFTKPEYTAGGSRLSIPYALNVIHYAKWSPHRVEVMLMISVDLPSSPGVAADAKVGSDLIQVQAVDNDIGNNSLVLYSVLSIRYIRLQSNDSEDIGNVFIIGQSSSCTS